MTDDRSSMMEIKPRLFDVWRDFLAFVMRPRLLGLVQPRDASAVKQVGALLLLALVLTVVFLLLEFIAELGPGVSLPGLEYDLFDQSPAMVIFSAIILAPLLEEVLFRSWLEGRPTSLKLIAGIVMAIACIWLSIRLLDGLVEVMAILILPLGIFFFALLWIANTNGRAAGRVYHRVFPALFWLSSIGFGLIHLTNYVVDDRIAALPLIFPQALIGLILGYARLRYGMWANIALHASYNTVLVMMVFIFA